MFLIWAIIGSLLTTLGVVISGGPCQCCNPYYYYSYYAAIFGSGGGPTTFGCPIDWEAVAACNGGSLFMSLPCPNTPDPLEFQYNVGVPFRFAFGPPAGAWGICAEDMTIRLDCESEFGSTDPLSGVPQITGNHGGSIYRVPITIHSLCPFFATFTELPFDGGNPNSNEPCGGCGEDPGTASGTIEP